MGNMMVTFGSLGQEIAAGTAARPLLSLPYRYFFSFGVVTVCAGLIVLVLFWRESADVR
jgi:protein-S-isoprenylcysteine O-methyltransferase Ste14